jgi:hypothetical protein
LFHDITVSIRCRTGVKVPTGLSAAAGAALDRVTSPRRAFVVAHPPWLSFTILNLVRALVGEGFGVVVLVTSAPPNELHRAIEAAGGVIVTRSPAGRDIGGYADALRYLLADRARLEGVEWVVLANDSMFWSARTGEHIRRLLEIAPRWGCFTENLSPVHHAQSYFVALGSMVLQTEAFRRFWLTYRPWNDRRHVVRAGEIGLSRAIAAECGPPTCLFSLERFRAVLRRDRGPTLNTALACDAIPTPSLHQRCTDSHPWPITVQPVDGIPFDAPLEPRANPTHRHALALHTVFGAPIKRDLTFRRGIAPGLILEHATEFSADERHAMESDLVARGSIHARPLHERLLARTGRR